MLMDGAVEFDREWKAFDALTIDIGEALPNEIGFNSVQLILIPYIEPILRTSVPG